MSDINLGWEQTRILHSLFDSARDITDALRATDIARYLDDDGRLDFLGNDDGPECMLGDNYLPDTLREIDAAVNPDPEDEDHEARDLIDPNGDGCLVYSIDIDSGLFMALCRWWGVKKAGLDTMARDLIGKWRDAGKAAGRDAYTYPTSIMLPVGAVLSGDGQTLLVATVSHWGCCQGVEYMLLGLELNDGCGTGEAGVKAFFESIFDPTVTRESYIASRKAEAVKDAA